MTQIALCHMVQDCRNQEWTLGLMARHAFSSTYFEAREKFLAAASERNLGIETLVNDETSGPNGEALYSDLVTLGNPDARNRILLISATHGVEGFCGSGCQTAFLRSSHAEDLPKDTCIVFLHALNPHGFSWLRRVNENNIDLNRNFINFSSDPPVNEHYDTLRSTMIIPDLNEETVRAANREMVLFGKAHGFDTLQEGLTRGQYVDAEGLYYGGAAPAWSNRLLREVLQTRVRGAERAIQIDFHTGLGPYGHGEIISEYEEDDPTFARAKAWLGEDVTSTRVGDSSSAALTGTTDHAFHQELVDVEGVSVALEFGTIASDEVFDATRADNWLHLNGNLASPQGKQVKSDMRAAFYADEDAWKEKVQARGEEIILRSIEALTSR